MKRSKPLKRSRMKRSPSPPGFPEPVRMFVRRRSGGKCEVRSRVCSGVPQHFHHRKLRRHRDHTSANCLYVCAACHRYIHDQMGEAAYLMGWLVKSWDDPAQVPIRRGEGG